MHKSLIFKAAHKLTKRVIKTGDNYPVTFGLCLRTIYDILKSGMMFSRRRSDGSLLECKLENWRINYYVSGKLIAKKSLAGYQTMLECKKYFKDITQWERLVKSGAFGFWNIQIALSECEFWLAVSFDDLCKLHAEVLSAYQSANYISVILSSRGWGDYDNLTWVGDVNQPDGKILQECKHLFEKANDVDVVYNATSILAAIKQAKVKHFAKIQSQISEKKAAEAYIKNAPQKVKDAYTKCGGNPERLQDDIDHPLYWQVKRYAEAIMIISE